MCCALRELGFTRHAPTLQALMLLLDERQEVLTLVTNSIDR